jgi:Lon protease-like protein
MPQTSIAFFPLSAHLLPGGRLALRIFEPRYIRMVKQACAGQRQFGMCMHNPNGDMQQNKHIYPIGTLAKIVDFETLPDGFLGIKVEGGNCFEIQAIETEEDGLRVGEINEFTQWEGDFDQPTMATLSEKLAEIFSTFSEFSTLYSATAFDQSDWVLFRWLELLPVDVRIKQELMMSKDYNQLGRYVSQWVRPD